MEPTLLKVRKKVNCSQTPGLFLSLTYEQRQKTRLRAVLSDQREVAIMLQRGQTLKDGDCLQADDGSLIRIQASDEQLSTVSIHDSLLLAKACYHLGNRHIPLQIEQTRLCYLHDHVLDDMLEQMGLNVKQEFAPFQPESGAYAHSHHQHLHTHEIKHDH